MQPYGAYRAESTSSVRKRLYSPLKETPPVSGYRNIGQSQKGCIFRPNVNADFGGSCRARILAPGQNLKYVDVEVRYDILREVEARSGRNRGQPRQPAWIRMDRLCRWTGC